MPYLPPEERALFDDALDGVPTIRSKGQLTYCVTRLMLRFAREHGLTGYQRHSDAVAATADAGHEYRRRVLDKYENDAIRRNGDLFEIYASAPL